MKSRFSYFTSLSMLLVACGPGAVETSTADDALRFSRAPHALPYSWVMEPDLQISFHLDGGTARPHVVIRRTGPATITKGFSIRTVYPSSTKTTYIHPGSTLMAELNGPNRATEYLAASWDGSMPAGTDVEMIIDAFNTISESNEANNTFSQTWGVDECSPPADSLAPLADLRIEVVKDPNLALAHVTIHNDGGEFVPEFFSVRAHYLPSYGSVFGGGHSQIIAGNALTAIQNTGSYSFKMPVLVNDALKTTVLLQADSDCRIEEPNKLNNLGGWNHQPTGAACALGQLCDAAKDICAPSSLSCADATTIRACAAHGRAYADYPCSDGQTCLNGQCVW